MELNVKYQNGIISFCCLILIFIRVVGLCVYKNTAKYDSWFFLGGGSLTNITFPFFIQIVYFTERMKELSACEIDDTVKLG